MKSAKKSEFDTVFLKNIAVYALTAVLCLLVIFYMLYHLFNRFSDEIETETAFLTTKREMLVLDAYLVRDERVLSSSAGGGANFLFENGERVSAGDEIVDIYSVNGGEALSEKIIELDKKITLLENSNTEKNSTSADTQIIDGKISQLYLAIREKIEEGDVEYALRKKNELLELLNKRQIVVQAVSGFDDQILLAKDERSRLTSSLSDISERLYAPKSGYFFTGVDGYESVFTLDKVESLSLSVFDEMIGSEPAETGFSVGKLVTDYHWYIICEITREENRSFSEGLTYQIVFPYSSSEEIDMTLKKIIAPTDSDRVLLLFESGNMPVGFNFLRKQEIEVVRNSYSGYQVPVSAVRMVDGKQGVYILVGNVIHFKEITPLLEQDDYYIVAEQPSWMDDENYRSKLGLYDQIITKGTNLYEGKIVDA